MERTLCASPKNEKPPVIAGLPKQKGKIVAACREAIDWFLLFSVSESQWTWLTVLLCLGIVEVCQVVASCCMSKG